MGARCPLRPVLALTQGCGWGQGWVNLGSRPPHLPGPSWGGRDGRSAAASTCISNSHRSCWPRALFPAGGSNRSPGAPARQRSHRTPPLSPALGLCIQTKTNANELFLLRHPERTHLVCLTPALRGLPGVGVLEKYLAGSRGTCAGVQGLPGLASFPHW